MCKKEGIIILIENPIVKAIPQPETHKEKKVKAPSATVKDTEPVTKT